MLRVDHDKILLLSTPFPTIPMLGKNCCYNVLCSMLEVNDVVLYCGIVLAASLLAKIYSHCVTDLLEKKNMHTGMDNASFLQASLSSMRFRVLRCL